jgi:hypothetical protein
VRAIFAPKAALKPPKLLDCAKTCGATQAVMTAVAILSFYMDSFRCKRLVKSGALWRAYRREIDFFANDVPIFRKFVEKILIRF